MPMSKWSCVLALMQGGLGKAWETPWVWYHEEEPEDEWLC